jgi:acetyl esterase/lipase
LSTLHVRAHRSRSRVAQDNVLESYGFYNLTGKPFVGGPAACGARRPAAARRPRGGAEALLDDSQRIVDRARKAGVSVTFEVGDDMIHAWHLFASAFEVCRRDVQRAGKMLRESVERVAAGAASKAISP